MHPHWEEGWRTPSIWGEDEQPEEITPMYVAGFNLNALEQPAFVVNDSLALGADTVDREVHQIACDGPRANCYWYSKNDSCRWGDTCKFIHRRDRARRM